MQTFLPSPSFSESARVLDNRRLGKQRVETFQVLKALQNPDYGWQNHPAVNMWRGYGEALLRYQEAICFEWTENRGFRDTCLRKAQEVYETMTDQQKGVGEIPAWLGNPKLHLSHQSNLLRKEQEFYRKHFPNVPDDLEYVWPSREVPKV